jgi:hypothetical protein
VKRLSHLEREPFGIFDWVQKALLDPLTVFEESLMSYSEIPDEGYPDPYQTTEAITPPEPPSFGGFPPPEPPPFTTSSPFGGSPPTVPYAMSPVPGPPPGSLHDSRALGIIGIVLGALALVGAIFAFRPIVLVFGLLMAIVAVVLGHIGFARGGNGGKGQGVAIAALILGYLAIAVVLVHLIGMVALFRFLRRRRRGF